ncbi:MAG: hypothetical protein P8Y53_00590 [Pseudolabrys sp.]
MTEPADKRRATVLGCPTCGSALYELGERDGSRFRCPHGHGYTPEEICPGIAYDLQDLLPDVVDALTR